MKTENRAFIRSCFKVGFAVGFAVLYSLGGFGFLWARRYAAPAELTMGIFFLSGFDRRALVTLPLMIGTLSLGYGAEALWLKIIKRAVFGLANGASSSAYAAWNKKWLIVGTQVLLLAGLYVIIGVWNPLGSARSEEMMLGMVIPLIPLFSIPD